MLHLSRTYSGVLFATTYERAVEIERQSSILVMTTEVSTLARVSLISSMSWLFVIDVRPRALPLRKN